MRIVSCLLLAAVLGAGTCPAYGRKSIDKKESSVSEAGNQFALDLYARLGQEKSGNLFFSPTSISVALTMAAGGARGQTEAEMVKVLHLPPDLKQVHAEYQTLLSQWNAAGEERGYQLRVANRLWGQKGYQILDAYLTLTRKQYNAEMALVDYANDAQGARLEINNWVEQQTEKKIKNLIPRGALDQMTRLVLTNAIYFKGDWVKQFDKDRTRDQDFKLSATEKVKVPMMYQKTSYGYAEYPALQVLEMPYEGKDLSMLVLLPRKVDGLAELERSLSVDQLAAWRAKLRKRQVITYMPKFKLETSFNLNATLKALGIKSAFSQAADFSGISGREDLYISDVLHKAFVDVNEEGTEAAAATGLVFKLKSAEPRPRPIPVFRADHPFVFMIRNNRTGGILFLGRMVNPNG